MSADFCQTATAASLQLGRRGAGIKSLSGTEVATRNAGDTALVTLEVATPTADQHAATKLYVDNLINGLSWKDPVKTCTTTALPANTAPTSDTLQASANGALPAIDGVSLAVGESLLVKDESAAPVNNGIYVVTDLGSATTPWILTRRADAAAGLDATNNAVFCSEGTVGADKAFTQTADSAIYGTTALTWIQFASIAAGVTSIANAAGITGISIIQSGAAPVPTLRAILGESGVLTATLVGTDIVISVDAGGISTAKIANQAVTVAKIAPFATIACVRGTITFSDQGTTVTLGTLPTNSRVIKTEVDVTVLFDDATMTVDVQVNAVSVQGTNESDLNAVDIYECAANEENAAGVAVDAVVSSSTTVTQGSANICAYYQVTA